VEPSAIAHRRLLAVHAHPDDEAITTGGLLATCAEAGIITCLVSCTDGRYGPVNPELGLTLTPDQLAEMRASELETASKILAVSEVRRLGYHDSGMTGSSNNLAPRAFWAQHMHTLVGRLVAILRDFRPHVAVTYDPFGCTGHPDHIQAHRVTILAIEAAAEQRPFPHVGRPWQVMQLFYPVYPLSVLQSLIEGQLRDGHPHPFEGKTADEVNYSRPDDYVTHRVDIRPVYQRKKDALHAHRTQVGSHHPALYQAALARREYEHFRLAFSHHPDPRFDDVLTPVGR
jgi:N-acetyl-1-D-myo-inositol-2-amino-2-deoxy-alpha-D-glucopyranoside deacetylase